MTTDPTERLRELLRTSPVGIPIGLTRADLDSLLDRTRDRDELAAEVGRLHESIGQLLSTTVSKDDALAALAAKDAEIERLKERIAALEKKLADAQTYITKLEQTVDNHFEPKKG